MQSSQSIAPCREAARISMPRVHGNPRDSNWLRVSNPTEVSTRSLGRYLSSQSDVGFKMFVAHGETGVIGILVGRLIVTMDQHLSHPLSRIAC